MEKIEEDLIRENTGLILNIANKFYNVDKNDLFQAGALGLIKAYRNYKKNGITKFSTYAYEYIFGEMYLLANNREIKISKDIIKLKKMIEKGRNILSQKLGYDPSIHELALFLEIDESKLNEAILCSSTVTSLDEKEEGERSIHEEVACEEKVPTLDRIFLKDCINTLKPVEQDIIYSRYFNDLTQSETAEKLGLTQVMVSRYESKSLKKMREYMYM